MQSAEAVVIGAGVMGSAAARTLGERGVETILLEQFDLGHARGSSHGPTRIFRIAYPDPMYVRLAQRAQRAWRELEAAANEELVVPTGGLDTGPMADVVGQALEACSVPHERLSPAEASERFPQISFDGLDPIVYQPDAGVSRADRTVAAQVRLAREAGVEVLHRTPVEAIVPGDDSVEVRTPDSSITARVAVATAGPWAGPLLERHGSAVPLQPILQTVSYFGPADPGGDVIPTFIEWGAPAPELVWYALGPAGEAPGVKVGAHVGGLPVDPEDGPFEPDPELTRVQADYVRRRFPALQPEPVRSETCLYTMTADEDFVLDRVGSVVIGAGFSGHGFKFGPLIGEILANLALGLDPGLDLDRFRAGRAALQAS